MKPIIFIPMVGAAAYALSPFAKQFDVNNPPDTAPPLGSIVMVSTTTTTTLVTVSGPLRFDNILDAVIEIDVPMQEVAQGKTNT
jgi:hypothetical protein